MASIVRFTALYGVKSDGLALSGMLELDNYKILLDCGWNEEFNEDLLEPLRSIAPKIDAVLISHPDTTHLGALPYAIGKLGLDAPVFATLPVWKMGQMFAYDVYEAKRQQEEFSLFDLDDVDDAFKKITQLKFQQPFTMKGKGAGIVITPYSAGHMLGGTVWKIKKETEEMKDAEEILYAVDFNHRKERHLNPTALPTLTRPSHLIIGASHALTRFVPKVDLFEPVLAALERGGNVLVPVDTAGRVVELGLLFDEAWSQKKQLAQYPIAILSSVSFNTFDFARSMIEWMSDSIANMFDLVRENPFQFKKVHLCHTKAEVDALPSPKVVLSSFPGMEIGPSLQYFLEWGGDPRNLILFVDRVEHGTLAHELKNMQAPMHMRKKIKKRIPLDGAELKEWKELQKQKEIELGRHEEMPGVVGETADADAIAGAVDADLSQDEEEDGYDSLQTHRVELFPYQEKQSTWDDYGEIVDVTAFMIGEDPGGDDVDPMFEDDGEDISLMDTTVKMEGITEKVEDEKEKIPTKCIEEIVDLDVRCETVSRDFSGLCDGRSLKELIVAVVPRRLVVVHGTEEETRAVAEIGLNTLGMAKDAVVCPSNRETVDVTSDTSVYRLRLNDNIFDTLRWRRIGDSDIAYVHGIIRLEQSEEKEDVILDPSPPSESGHATIFVGDAKLNEVKQKLRLSYPNMKPEFASGSVLYTENTDTGAVVTIKKKTVGDFEVNANLSEDYFQFRDHLYTHFVTL